MLIVFYKAIRIVFPVLFFFYLSCDENSDDENSLPSTLVLGDTINIGYMETAVNYDENISLIFDTLFADSRCPVGMECFWEGDAEPGFTLTGTDSSTSFSLHTFSGFPNDTIIQCYSIELIDVSPYPHVDSIYQLTDYSVMITLDKATSEECDLVRLKQMEQDIIAYIGVPECGDSADCQSIGFGAKPCGGHWTYLVYSATTVDSTVLRAMVNEHYAFNDTLNARYGWGSDCMYVISPQVDCMNGICTAVSAMESP